MLVWNEFAIAQHFAYGFDPAQIALKPNALLYGRVAIVRSSDQDFVVTGISLWAEMCSLHFSEGFSASLASCGSAGSQGVCQEDCTTCILKLGFSQLVMRGSSPCLRLLGRQCLWLILLAVVVLACGLAGTSKCLQELWIQFGCPSLKCMQLNLMHSIKHQPSKLGIGDQGVLEKN